MKRRGVLAALPPLFLVASICGAAYGCIDYGPVDKYEKGVCTVDADCASGICNRPRPGRLGQCVSHERVHPR